VPPSRYRQRRQAPLARLHSLRDCREGLARGVGVHFHGGVTMDRSSLSLLPHHSWFGFSFEMPPAKTVVHEARETNHTLVIGTATAVDVQWIHRGCERLYRHGLDQVAFFASDNDVHTRVIRSGGAPSSSYLLKMPRQHLINLAGSDGADMPSDLPPSAAPKVKLDFRLPTDQPCAVAEA
jgi:hypothetical protein